MKKHIWNVLLALVIAVGAVGCAKTESHSSRGVIEQVRDGGKVLVIKHEEFPGFMEAMTMPFEVKNPALAEGLKAGDSVKFTIEKIDDSYPIVKISKTEAGR